MKAPKFRLFGFRRPHEVASPPLGKLERAVMDKAWQSGKFGTDGTGGELRVRDVYMAFDERYAYTTLMTTLDRLYKKGLLNRRKEGRAFLYSPSLSPQQLEETIAQDIIGTLLGRAAPVLAYFVEAVGERDRELLDELDRLVKDKRDKLERRD